MALKVLDAHEIGTVPGGMAAVKPAGPAGMRQRVRRAGRLVGVVPFLAYLVLFLIIPSISVVTSAFQDAKGHGTFANIAAALHGVYFEAFAKSLELSGLSSAIAALAGTLIAVALGSTSSPSVRHVVTTGSGVFANTGGLPLAFSFIAAYGNFGIVTRVLSAMGWNPYDHGFTIYSLLGLLAIYLYFLIPLMVLVMLPAVENLRREWFEAASVLGGRSRDAWRHVGLPILLPSFLAAFMVLFTDAFAAYATAAVLTQGTVPLVPIEIGTLVQGNVLSGQQNVGDALGLGMIVVVFVAAALYATLQRRVARWHR